MNGNQIAKSSLLLLGLAVASTTSEVKENRNPNASKFISSLRKRPIQNVVGTTDLNVFSSRYGNEFQELRQLGKGGFGSVYCARNVTDGILYAVKKIRLSPESGRVVASVIDSMCTSVSPVITNFATTFGNQCKELREPLVMSTISNHQNVVSYHSAWMEIAPSNESPKISRRTNKINNYYDVEGEQIHLLSTTSDSTFSNATASTASHEILSLNSKTQNNDGNLREHTEKRKMNFMLFIQLQLCGDQNLKEWMESHPERAHNVALNASIFKQIVLGLNHIHRNSFIHRDVKPGNIFVVNSEEGKVQIKIGDFGLTIHNSIQNLFPDADWSSEVGSPSNSDEHTSGVGSPLYASPEQLQGGAYTEKSDIFSLGIVTFELYNPFKTAMERTKILSQLRASRLSDSFQEKYPKESGLIKAMLSHTPENRPSTQEILQTMYLLQQWQKIRINCKRVLYN